MILQRFSIRTRFPQNYCFSTPLVFKLCNFLLCYFFLLCLYWAGVFHLQFFFKVSRGVRVFNWLGLTKNLAQYHLNSINSFALKRFALKIERKIIDSDAFKNVNKKIKYNQTYDILGSHDHLTLFRMTIFGLTHR